MHLRNILDAIMLGLVHGGHPAQTTGREKANLLAQAKGCPRLHLRRTTYSSWPGLARPSTSLRHESKTWMPATSAGMTERVRRSGHDETRGRVQRYFEQMNPARATRVSRFARPVRSAGSSGSRRDAAVGTSFA